MVENVEEFCAQLKCRPLLESEISERREIQLRQPRSEQCVATNIAKGIESLSLECLDIKPLVHRALDIVRISYQVRAVAATCVGSGRRVFNCEGCAALYVQNAIELPV